MIEFKNLTISNNPGRNLIENESLVIQSGTLTALIGRNGCGKSTLLRVMAGAQAPACGSVLINGVDVKRAYAGQMARLVSVITTARVEVSNLTCRELVAYGRAPHTGIFGLLSDADNKIIDDSLKAVNMMEFASRKVSRISDGESRRILIACTLAQQTPVILLDEPTSFLDVPGRYEICSLLAQLCHDQGKTILYSTHELEPAFMYADNILFMKSDGFSLLPPDQMRRSGLMTEFMPAEAGLHE